MKFTAPVYTPDDMWAAATRSLTVAPDISTTGVDAVWASSTRTLTAAPDLSSSTVGTVTDIATTGVNSVWAAATRSLTDKTGFIHFTAVTDFSNISNTSPFYTSPTLSAGSYQALFYFGASTTFDAQVVDNGHIIIDIDESNNAFASYTGSGSSLTGRGYMVPFIITGTGAFNFAACSQTGSIAILQIN